MECKIGGKNYEIRFSLAGLDYLDSIYHKKESGITFGIGISMLAGLLMEEQPQALFHAIKAGTIKEKGKPSNDEIESYLEEVGEAEGLEKLFEDFLLQLRRQPLTKGTMKKVDKNVSGGAETAK